MKKLLIAMTALAIIGVALAETVPAPNSAPAPTSEESILTPGARLVAGDPEKNEFYIVDNDHPLPKTGVYQPPGKAVPPLQAVAKNKPEPTAPASNADLARIQSALDQVEQMVGEKAITNPNEVNTPLKAALDDGVESKQGGDKQTSMLDKHATKKITSAEIYKARIKKGMSVKKVAVATTHHKGIQKSLVAQKAATKMAHNKAVIMQRLAMKQSHHRPSKVDAIQVIKVSLHNHQHQTAHKKIDTKVKMALNQKHSKHKSKSLTSALQASHRA